jgi:hypothetical protein
MGLIVPFQAGDPDIPVTLINAVGDLIVGMGDNAVSALPVGANGATLVADSAVGGGLKWAGSLITLVVKPSDTSRSTTVVLADDPHLLFPMLASKNYMFEIGILYTCGSTGDFAWSIAGPAGPVRVHYGGRGFISTSADTNAATAYSTNIPVAGGGNAGTVWAAGCVENGTTPGNLRFQWCQGTSNGTATVVQTGSRIWWKEL